MKTEIEQRFEADAKMLPEIRERFMKQVVRWVYSKTEIWSYEDRRWKGRKADRLQGPKGAIHTCGLDAADNPVVLIEFQTEFGRNLKPVPTKDIFCEEFIAHHGDVLEVTRTTWGKLRCISRLTFQGHLQVEDVCVNEGFYGHSRMHYDGRKPKLQQNLNADGRIYHEIVFGPRGEETYFRVRRDGSRFELGQPLPEGVTVKSLKETVRDRLKVLVPKLVSAAKIREPIYCVALAYDDEGNDALPPFIGIGLDSERRRWKAEHGKRAKDYVWNPEEFHHYEKPYTQLDDDALEEACDYLNGKWSESGSTAPAAKLLMEVAAELNRVDWPVSVRRTTDFVAYAIGLEGSGLKKSLKAGLNPEKLAKLKADGWL